MNFTEACRYYINKYLTFNQTPNELNAQNSGNALLYMATYYQIKEIVGELTDFNKTMFEQMLKFYKSEHSIGVLNRYPSNTEQLQAYDDYVGLLNATSLFNSTWSRDVMFRKYYCWYFDNQDAIRTNPRCWYGRFPGFVAHVYFSNKRLPSLFNRFTWVIKVLSDANNYESMSDKIMTWHMIRCYQRSGFKLTICDAAVNIWIRNLKASFPNLMGTVFEKYYNTEHPFAIYMKGKF